MPKTFEQSRAFLSEHDRGVLATIKGTDGRPQLTNVLYGYFDGRIHISVTQSRAKTVNARKDPRVSLHVTSEDFWSYVVAEGVAQLSDVATTPGDDTCRRLLALYEEIRAEPHPEPDEFFEAMVAERRLELAFEPEHFYPLR